MPAKLTGFMDAKELGAWPQHLEDLKGDLQRWKKAKRYVQGGKYPTLGIYITMTPAALLLHSMAVDPRYHHHSRSPVQS